MKRRLILVAIAAIVLLCAPLAAYVTNFGTKWSTDPGTWGQFGDFIGGSLNPLYALLAFLALLYNLRLQSEQVNSAKEEAREAARSAQAQIDALRQRADRDEIQDTLAVIAATLDSCLDEFVSPNQSHPQLQLRQVIHEGWRLRSASVKGGPYDDYVRTAQTGGTIVEELHSRVKRTAEALFQFVGRYEAIAPGMPMATFYKQRYIGLGQLLEDVGGCKPEVVAFFRSADAAA
jgi:type II secretory pathway pseudopilin PulG